MAAYPLFYKELGICASEPVGSETESGYHTNGLIDEAMR